MHICRVQIKNYRNLKSVDVKLGEIVTLIGENNSGKSNFLRAIALPLSAEDHNISKHLSWYDLNKEAKDEYYKFLRDNRQAIISGAIDLDKFISHLPTVSIQLDVMPSEIEHYDVAHIRYDDGEEWVGGILYRFYPGKKEKILEQVKAILKAENANKNIQMSLLPVELYTYSITIPAKGSRIPYEILSRFKAVVIPAERDNFASSAERMGSRALSEILQKGLSPDAQVKIEKKYSDFFDTIKSEGKLDAVLNWQDYSDIPNAKDFFDEISVLPNMPQIGSILGSVRLGYDDDNMFMQGLGHRNLILMSVLLNSYMQSAKDLSLRVVTVEEPEAHLCNSNILLLASLFNAFSKKSKRTQIIYSTHNAEFVNKVGLGKVIVLCRGNVLNLGAELETEELDYLAANPNTDIFKLLYSRKAILVEGITEELLIKSYLQTRPDLNEIKVISFHKGFRKIMKIWKAANVGLRNKLGIVRDYDNEPNAQKEHENEADNRIIVCTTEKRTLEPEIVNSGENYNILKKNYGRVYGWENMTPEELSDDWREKKSDVMLTICHDLISGNLSGFSMPKHIQEIIDFMQGDNHAD